MGEEGFSVSHLWLLTLGAAVAGDGFKGVFATGLVAAPPYRVNLKQKGYRDLPKNVKKIPYKLQNSFYQSFNIREYTCAGVLPAAPLVAPLVVAAVPLVGAPPLTAKRLNQPFLYRTQRIQ